MTNLVVGQTVFCLKVNRDISEGIALKIQEVVVKELMTISSEGACVLGFPEADKKVSMDAFALKNSAETIHVNSTFYTTSLLELDELIKTIHKALKEHVNMLKKRFLVEKENLKKDIYQFCTDLKVPIQDLFTKLKTHPINENWEQGKLYYQYHVKSLLRAGISTTISVSEIKEGSEEDTIYYLSNINGIDEVTPEMLESTRYYSVATLDPRNYIWNVYDYIAGPPNKFEKINNFNSTPALFQHTYYLPVVDNLEDFKSVLENFRETAAIKIAEVLDFFTKLEEILDTDSPYSFIEQNYLD